MTSDAIRTPIGRIPRFWFAIVLSIQTMAALSLVFPSSLAAQVDSSLYLSPNTTEEDGWHSPNGIGNTGTPPLLASRPNGFDFDLTGTGNEPLPSSPFGIPGFRSADPTLEENNIINSNFQKTSAFDISPTSGNLVAKEEETYTVQETGNERFVVPDQDALITPIVITASAGWKGPATADGEVYILTGDCRITQGTDQLAGPKAVLWLRDISNSYGILERQVDVYLEKENSWEPLKIAINRSFLSARATDNAWFGTLCTTAPIDIHIAEPGADQIDPEEIFKRASAMRATMVSEVHSQEIPNTSRIEDKLNEVKNIKNIGARKIRIMSRYDQEMKIRTEPDQNDPTKSHLLINDGFTIMIEGISSDQGGVSDVIDISADNALIWGPGIDQLKDQREQTREGDMDLEIFLDGDIVFREGDMIVYASKMYYDVKNKIGIIHDSEAVLPVPDTPGGWFRIKADTITQNGLNTLSATNAWVSTSMMGEPSYRLQTNSLTAEMHDQALYDTATGQPIYDPETGKQKVRKNSYIIAENNTVRLGCVPIFYWPWMAMNTKNQSLYLKSINIANDRTYGTQVRTQWDLMQLFNLGSKCKDKGKTDWTLDLDYLSKRGFGHGTTFSYERNSCFGHNAPSVGTANYYGISDRDTDNLGEGRRAITHDNKYRYRGIWKHKQAFELPCLKDSPGCLSQLSEGWTGTLQLGTSSDRHYLQSYFEEEWYTQSNPETCFEFKRTVNNRAFGILGNYRMDKFYTATNQLPRVEHFWLGQPIFCNHLLWYEHTQLGYSQFRTTDAPTDSTDQEYFRYLDWELEQNSLSNTATGDVSTLKRNAFTFSSRQELDIPFELGPVKFTPYGLGEFGYWGTGTENKAVSRLYGRGGIRTNLPVWKVDSDVSSRMFYLNGLAHKMNFGMDAYYSRVNKHFTDLTLFNQLDDWQTEEYRRLYSTTTFSNTYEPYRDSIPVRFDERYYALRQGLIGGSVATPYTEIADDLTQVRFDWLNRWQTKRGPVGHRHTIDWITLDAGISVYPKKEQNFDQTLGLTDYDFRWHVGDRFSVLSSGLFDFFGSGQKIVRAGVMTKHPGSSNLYVGVDRLGGPISSTFLNATLNYRMSEKWAMSLGSSVDLAEGHNIGQQLGISRIGESFVVSLSTNINTSKNDWGVNLNVLPIFMYSTKKFDEEVLGVGSM